MNMVLYTLNILWILVLQITFCLSEFSFECSMEQQRVCSEGNRFCQPTIKDDGSDNFECLCQYPFVENVNGCEYEPNADHYSLKLQLSNLTEPMDLDDIESYLLVRREVQYLVRRLFPGATVSLVGFTEIPYPSNFPEEYINRIRDPEKSAYYATMLISAVGLSKSYLKRVWKSRTLKPLESKLFSVEVPGLLTDVRRLDYSPCLACSASQHCNPQSRTLCSCKEADHSCEVPQAPRLDRGLEDWDGETYEDNLKVFRNEKSLEDVWDEYPACPEKEATKCRSKSAMCIPDLSSNSYMCECQLPFVSTEDGNCEPVELNKNTNIVRVNVRSDAPWSNDLENHLSYRYVKMKRNAEKFLQAIFSDASISGVNFRRSEREGRQSDLEPFMEFILWSTKEYTTAAVREQLLKFQSNDVVSVPGIAFSVPADFFLVSTPLQTTTTTTEAPTPAKNPCLPNPCGPAAICVVTFPNDYVCVCPKDYTFTDGTCKGSCSNNPCGIQGTCITQGSSYTCSCASGLQYTGGTCKDIDECTVSNPCTKRGDFKASCVNIFASYACTCSFGYTATEGSCVKPDYQLLQIIRVILQTIIQAIVFLPIIFLAILLQLLFGFFSALVFPFGKKRSLDTSSLNLHEKDVLNFLVNLSDREEIERVFRRLSDTSSLNFSDRRLPDT